MAFNSCENENVNESFSNDGTVTMNFVAGVPESRTSVAIDGNAANYSWSKGDKVGFYYVATDPGVSYKKKGNSKEAVIADDGTATFSMTFEPSAEATIYNVGAFYPGMSWVSHSTENPFNNVKVKIPAEQNLVEGTFDPAADLMMSKPFIGIALSDQATVHTLEFSRIAAIGKMNLTLTGAEADEYIKSVVFTLANGNHFNGPVMLDLENGTYEIVESETTNAVSLSGVLETASGSASVFFTCLPGDFTGAYTIEVSTNKANYSKEGTLSKTLSFTAGDVLGFNATVGNREEVAEEESLAGDYIIVAKRSSGNFFYMTTSLTTTSTKRVAAVDTNSTAVDGVAINEAYVWTVAKSGATYTMQTPGGKYLTWTSSNSANFADTAGDNTALLIVAGETEGTYNVKFNQEPSRILALNSTAGTDYFAFYSGTQEKDLYFIPVTPADPNAPSLSVAQTEVNLENTECEGTVAIEAKNIEGAINVVSSNEDWLVAEIDEDGNLYYIAGANDGVARTATVTLSANGVADVVVTFNQAANQSAMPGTGEGTEASPYDVTRAYAVIDAAGGSVVEGVYVKGIVTEDAISFNSSYKSLTYYISNDGTATNKFQVYSGKNLDNTDFASTGDLHAGDEVVVCGNIKKYNTTYEFDYNNYIVSLNCPHAAGSVEQTVTFTSKPESVTVGKTVAVAATAKTTVTYSSSNAAVATIDANTGVVTGVAEGTVTITATAATEGIYKQATASYQLTVNAAQSGVETSVYVKVTSAPADWSGTYLMVYENSSSVGYVFKSNDVTSKNNYTTGTVISGGEIEATDELANYAVTVAAYSTGYSIKSVGSSKYLQGKGSGSNGTNAYDTPSLATTFTFNSDGTVSIINNTNHFVFNTGGYMRFYKATTATGSQYKKLCLYKLAQ